MVGSLRCLIAVRERGEGIEAMSQVLSGFRFCQKKGVNSTLSTTPSGCRQNFEIKETLLVKEGDQFLPMFTEMVIQNK
jgi:hypothetical protein